MLNNVTKIIDHSGYEHRVYDLVGGRWCFCNYYPKLYYSKDVILNHIVACIHGGCRIRIKKGVCTIS